MCYGMGCKYEQSGGPEAGECTLPAIMCRNFPSDAACAEAIAEDRAQAKYTPPAGVTQSRPNPLDEALQASC